MDTSGNPWYLVLVLGCVLALLGLRLPGGSSASKASPNKIGRKKRSTRSEVLTQAGGGSAAGNCGTHLSFSRTRLFVYFIAMVGLCGVALEVSIVEYNPTKPAAEITAWGRGTMPAVLPVNGIDVPESWLADAAGKTRTLVETRLAGALLGRVALLKAAVVHACVAAANLSTEPPDAATIIRETLEATVIEGSDAVKHDARINFRHSTEAALSAPPDLTPPSLTSGGGSTSPCGALPSSPPFSGSLPRCASFICADSFTLEVEQGKLEGADQAPFALYLPRVAHSVAHCTPLPSSYPDCLVCLSVPGSSAAPGGHPATRYGGRAPCKRGQRDHSSQIPSSVAHRVQD